MAASSAAGMPLGEEGGWRAALRAQWLATWGLLPLSLAIFSRVSWISLPVNLMAIPVVTFAIVPMSMLGLLCWPLPCLVRFGFGSGRIVPADPAFALAATP